MGNASKQGQLAVLLKGFTSTNLHCEILFCDFRETTPQQYGQTKTELVSASAGRGGNARLSSDISTIDVAKDVTDIAGATSESPSVCRFARTLPTSSVASVFVTSVGVDCTGSETGKIEGVKPSAAPRVGGYGCRDRLPTSLSLSNCESRP